MAGGGPRPWVAPSHRPGVGGWGEEEKGKNSLREDQEGGNIWDVNKIIMMMMMIIIIIKCRVG